MQEGSQLKFFLIEDDLSLSQGIKVYLQKSLGLNIEIFSNLENFKKQLPASHEKICLITALSAKNYEDLIHFITEMQKTFSFLNPIFLASRDCVDLAILAAHESNFCYLTKPFELEKLKNLILEISEKFNCTHKVETSTDHFYGIRGHSASMKTLFDRISKVANSNATVLIQGESGTGKELVAKAIHEISARKMGPMISLNCAAIPSELLESELFGHKKGSFTGAVSDRVGKFELAHKGTIFLDEIGDMPLSLQVKLLRVLQSKQIEPIGSAEPFISDVRVIAATHRDLQSAIKKGNFREDLYYRLNVFPLMIPSLRERKEDIGLLIDYFIQKFTSRDGSNKIEFSAEAREQMFLYDWPGNVRELENTIERLIILCGGYTVKVQDLPFLHQGFELAKPYFELPAEGTDLKNLLNQIEDNLIMQALERCNGNKYQASKLLQLNRTTLIEKMKKKNLHYFQETPLN